MPKLPRQPDLERLRDLEPELITLPVGAQLLRIYFRGGKHPTLWNAFRYVGPTTSRFDHHRPGEHGKPRLQERGILYAALDMNTSLAEVFQKDRTIDRKRGIPWLVAFSLAKPLELLDLTGKYPLRAGSSLKLMTGPKSDSRRWAQGFYEVYPTLHGLHYPSSMTNSPAIALNERANEAGTLPEAPSFHRALSDPVMLTPLRNAARVLNYDLS